MRTDYSQARRVLALVPAAGLLGAVLSYALHHTTPLDNHDIGVLFVVATVAITAACTARLVSHRLSALPDVVALRRGVGGTRDMHRDDLDFCAALHAEALPHGLFPALGPRFLKAYLRTFLDSPYAASVIYAARGRPLGTIVGITDPAVHARWVLRRRGMQLAVLGALALSTRPRLAFRFARTRVQRYRRAWRLRGDAAEVIEQGTPPAVLSHVAVSPGARGNGIGESLVDAFVAAALAAGRDRVILTTLAEEDGAAPFYERLGWTETTRHATLDGLTSIEYERSTSA